MPLYEYECDACGHRFERIQKFSDPPADKCPKCGGAVHKLQSAPAFQFRGSGWYVTDYARKDQSGAKSDGASGEASKDKPDGASGEAPKDKPDKAAAKSDQSATKEKSEGKKKPAATKSDTA